jgi:hypothetical protein
MPSPARLGAEPFCRLAPVITISPEPVTWVRDVRGFTLVPLTGRLVAIWFARQAVDEAQLLPGRHCREFVRDHWIDHRWTEWPTTHLTFGPARQQTTLIISLFVLQSIYKSLRCKI